MLRLEEPAGEAEAVARSILGPRSDQLLGHAGVGFLAMGVVIAASEDVGLAGLRHLFHHHRGRQIPDESQTFGPEGVAFGLQCLDATSVTSGDASVGDDPLFGGELIGRLQPVGVADLRGLQDGGIGAEPADLAVEGLGLAVGAEEPVALGGGAGHAVMADLRGDFLAVDEQRDRRCVLLALDVHGDLMPGSGANLSSDRTDDRRVSRVTLARGPLEFLADEAEFAAATVADRGGVAGAVQGADDRGVGRGCLRLEPDRERRATFGVYIGVLSEQAGLGRLGRLRGLGQKLGVLGGETRA